MALRLTGRQARFGPLAGMDKYEHMPAVYGSFVREVESAQAGNWTVTVDDLGRVIPFDSGAAARTATLPLLASVDNGFTVGFVRSSGSNTVSVNQHATDGGALIGSPGGVTLWVVKVAGVWRTVESSRWLQRQKHIDGEVATGTTVLPADDTIPTNTEGDQYMALTVSLLSASSRVGIQIAAAASHSAAGNPNISMALFRDSITNAIAAVSTNKPNTATAGVILLINYDMASPGVGSTTFKVRIGGGSAGTTTFNGQSGGRHFAGINPSSIIVTEYMP